ncbi:hypothetical protein MNBD_BACTEROID01-1244 [hydrothermal vent metagenome]|uniref:Uncharacterized protein n=1 Tax=hydrothermal vent metagenome TaxID=652676 RepID=A0A3B0TVC9_9ZZZZ
MGANMENFYEAIKHLNRYSVFMYKYPLNTEQRLFINP